MSSDIVLRGNAANCVGAVTLTSVDFLSWPMFRASAHSSHPTERSVVTWASLGRGRFVRTNQVAIITRRGLPTIGAHNQVDQDYWGAKTHHGEHRRRGES